MAKSLDALEQTEIRSYEFLCPSGCMRSEPIYLTYEGLMEPRPVCLYCKRSYLPNLDYLRNLSYAIKRDVTFTPNSARAWLACGFPSFHIEQNQAVIENYATHMKSNVWTHATESNGGLYCPIVRIEGRLMLGFNRLQACIRAGFDFSNYTIEVR